MNEKGETLGKRRGNGGKGGGRYTGELGRERRETQEI